MAYREDEKEEMRIRQRIREILDEKIKDRNYKGEGYSGGRKYKQSKRVERDRKQRQRYRKSHDLQREYKPKRATGYDEFCGYGSYMNAGKYVKDVKRVKAGVKSAKKNDWVKFYKKWLKENKHMGGKEGMRQAGIEYRKMKGGYY
jgi:hypothetical protein